MNRVYSLMNEEHDIVYLERKIRDFLIKNSDITEEEKKAAKEILSECGALANF